MPRGRSAAGASKKPIPKQKPESPPKTSGDLVSDRAEQLARLFPEAVSEGKVDFERLRAALGSITEEGKERYSFNWAGKRDAIRLLQTPSQATLTPAPKESVNFEKTGNIYIEGDNLEVLKLLYKPYFGKIKMIYIDPPYNTGHDFIYPDNFADPLDTYLQLTGQKDSEGNLLTSNPESSGRFHSAWLSMMYPRLFIARQLLREDGFLVASIDDAEMPALRLLLNEIFGEENFVAALVWDRNRKNDAQLFSVGHEYMLVYARNKQFLRDTGVILRAPKEGLEDVREEFSRLVKVHGKNWEAIRKSLRAFFDGMDSDDSRKPLARYNQVDERGPFKDDVDISWPGSGGPKYDVPHPVTGRPCKVPSRGWGYATKARLDEEISKGNVVFGKDESTVPSLKAYLFEKTTQVMRSVQYSYAQKASQEFDAIFGGNRVFDNPKHHADLSQIIEYTCTDDSLILDFFSGSASLAHAVLATNRKKESRHRFICVQLPEPVNEKTTAGKNALKLGLPTIAEIGKERIRRVIGGLLNQEQDDLPLTGRKLPEDCGFRVFKLNASCFQKWNGNEREDDQSYFKTMEKHLHPLLPEYEPLNLIWEVAIKEGYGLNSKIEPVIALKGNSILVVTDPDMNQSFRICLDDTLKKETIKALDLGKDDLFICRDSALDDELAANLALQCRLKTI